MKLLLIAGHGAGDPGAVAAPYREAEETRTVAALLKPILQRRGIAVTTYPTDRNAFADCVGGRFLAMGRPQDYDYVLELHFNALSPDKGDGKTKGVECYVTTMEKGTGVEDAICASMAKLGLTNRRVKRKNWSVIAACKQAGTSAALLEICFIDDADDMKIYARSREAVARAIADGICEGFGIVWQEGGDTMAEPQNTPSLWAAEACKWAMEQGIVKGDDRGDLQWQTPVTKEQLCVMLYRARNK